MTNELESLRQENAELRTKLGWMRAAHMLAAQDELFFSRPDSINGPFVYNALTPTIIEGEPALLLICSDTFAYAYADAESVEYADAETLLRIGVEEGWPGLTRWIQSRRTQRGEPAEPIPSVKDRMLQWDTLRARIALLSKEARAFLAQNPENKLVQVLEGLEQFADEYEKGLRISSLKKAISLCESRMHQEDAKLSPRYQAIQGLHDDFVALLAQEMR